MKTNPMEVRLIDHMGDDSRVVDAARVSFAKTHDNYTDEQNASLIRYLARHQHWTPSAHCFLTFYIKAPIFVARQLVKHQVGLVWNEVSRRYVDSEPEFWFPEVWRGRPEGSMKQGSSGEIPDDLPEGKLSLVMQGACNQALGAYLWALEQGVAPEQARMILPLNTHTEWYWSGSLAAFARVCKLRLDPHAQAETREVAELINTHAAGLFPVSWEALVGEAA